MLFWGVWDWVLGWCCSDHRKKYLIEDVVDNKVVGRRKGFTASTWYILFLTPGFSSCKWPTDATCRTSHENNYARFAFYGDTSFCSVNALDASKETPELQGVPAGLKVMNSLLLWSPLYINSMENYSSLFYTVVLAQHCNTLGLSLSLSDFYWLRRSTEIVPTPEPPEIRHTVALFN